MLRIHVTVSGRVGVRSICWPKPQITNYFTRESVTKYTAYGFVASLIITPANKLLYFIDAMHTNLMGGRILGSALQARLRTGRTTDHVARRRRRLQLNLLADRIEERKIVMCQPSK